MEAFFQNPMALGGALAVAAADRGCGCLFAARLFAGNR
jgi:hypothetical protein